MTCPTNGQSLRVDHSGQEPEDIANIVSFLASRKSRNITGQSILVDAGMLSPDWCLDASFSHHMLQEYPSREHE